MVLPDPLPAPNLRAQATPSGIFDGYGFPPALGAMHLCGRRVYRAEGGHLTWDAFESNVPPAAVVAHYKSRLGERGFEVDGAGGRWRLPAGAPRPERILEVMDARADGPHRTCEKKPGDEAATVVLVSRDR